MKKVLKNVFVALSISLFVLPVYAEKIDSATAKKNIAKLFNGVTADKITPSPIDFKVVSNFSFSTLQLKIF